jgi:hypothetical protein
MRNNNHRMIIRSYCTRIDNCECPDLDTSRWNCHRVGRKQVHAIFNHDAIPAIRCTVEAVSSPAGDHNGVIFHLVLHCSLVEFY